MEIVERRWRSMCKQAGAEQGKVSGVVKEYLQEWKERTGENTGHRDENIMVLFASDLDQQVATPRPRYKIQQ